MGKTFKFPESEIQHSGIRPGAVTNPKFMFLSDIPEQDGELVYNGEAQFPNWKNFDPQKLLMEGEKSAIDAGLHYVTFTPLGNFGWSDDTQTPRQIAYEIKRMPIAEPTLQSNLTFSGDPQTPTWNDFDSNIITIGGDFENKIDVKTYSATFTPDGNHCWIGGNFHSITKTWAIETLFLAKPTVTPSYTFTSTEIAPIFTDFIDRFMAKSGDLSGIVVNSYSTTITLKDKLNTAWNDKTTDDFTVSWSITKRILPKISAPSLSISCTGSNISPNWQNFNSTFIVQSGTSSSTNVGTYSTTFALRDTINTCWSGDSLDELTFSWQITKALVLLPSQSGSLTFNGNNQQPTWNNFNSTWLAISGTTSSTNAGTHTATFTLKDPANSKWSDGTSSSARNVPWSMSPLKVAIPYISGSYTYNGNSQQPSIYNLDSTYVSLSGSTSATNAGSYTITCSLNNSTNTTWSDSTTATKNLSWSIAALKVTIPTISGSYTYNGNEQSPTIKNLNSTYVKTSGNTSASAAGSYTVTASLISKTNTQWSDGTTANKSLSWTINKAPFPFNVNSVYIPSHAQGYANLELMYPGLNRETWKEFTSYSVYFALPNKYTYSSILINNESTASLDSYSRNVSTSSESTKGVPNGYQLYKSNAQWRTSLEMVNKTVKLDLQIHAVNYEPGTFTFMQGTVVHSS